jgi:hypothetical protein
MTAEMTPTSRDREIGIGGTIARITIGGILLGSVVIGHTRTFHPLPWVVGLLVLPAIALLWQQIRTRYTPGRIQATGPVAHLLNISVFLALYLTPYYAPAIGFTSDAALLFYGASMLLAAARGYAGCEVLAISNAVLRRNDQIGCLVGAGGVLAAARLQPWRPWILGASAVFLALGFWSAYRRQTALVDGQVCRVKASRTIRATLWVAAVLTVAVAVLPPVLS